jgi:hypothetical protein
MKETISNAALTISSLALHLAFRDFWITKAEALISVTPGTLQKNTLFISLWLPFLVGGIPHILFCALLYLGLSVLIFHQKMFRVKMFHTHKTSRKHGLNLVQGNIGEQ